MCEKLRFLNVVDERQSAGRQTIIYNDGGIRPFKDGFTYSFNYKTGDFCSYNGVGIVVNKKYAGMSPEEIELICSVEDPVTSKDVRDACLLAGMTPRRAAECASVY